MNQLELAVGSRVQHRAWHWFATVAQPPPDPLTWQSHISIIIDDREVEVTYPIYSLLVEEHEFIYDWSEYDEAT